MPMDANCPIRSTSPSASTGSSCQLVQQFIIKAVPLNAEQQVAEREDHDLYSKLSALEDALQARNAKLRSGERKLRRIEAIPGYRLLAKIRRLTRIWR